MWYLWSQFCIMDYEHAGVGAIEFIICHSEVSIALAEEKKIPEVLLSKPSDVYISYLPLAHTFFRIIEEIFIWHGASIGFWRGDVKLLIDDVGELKSTIFCVVPRVLDRVYSGLTQKISSGGFLKKTLKKDRKISFYVYYYFQNSKRKTDLNCNYVYKLMTFTYTLYIVGKTYSDRQLTVIIRPLKVDGRNVCRTKFIIHLPTDFLLIVTVFVCRYRSFFL
ncbi:Long chain acyl-CoA synthetase 4 [Glycine soja]